jgi:hypothetical protein
MRRTTTLLLVTLGLLLIASVAGARGRGTATTTYRTRLMGLIPVTVKNINHSYGGGAISIGRGQRYRLGIGRLTVPVSTKMGFKLDRWLFKRFFFKDKNVVRTTRLTDGSVEIQQADLMTIKRGGTTEISDYRAKTRTLIDAGGRRTVTPMAPASEGGPVSQRAIMKVRDRGDFEQQVANGLKAMFQRRAR